MCGFCEKCAEYSGASTARGDGGRFRQELTHRESEQKSGRGYRKAFIPLLLCCSSRRRLLCVYSLWILCFSVLKSWSNRRTKSTQRLGNTEQQSYRATEGIRLTTASFTSPSDPLFLCLRHLSAKALAKANELILAGTHRLSNRSRTCSIFRRVCSAAAGAC